MRDANEIVNQEPSSFRPRRDRGALLRAEQTTATECRPTFPRERFISEFVVGFNWTAARAFRRTFSIGRERGEEESQPSSAFFVLSHSFERRRQLELDPAYTVDDLFGAASVRRDFRRRINNGGGKRENRESENDILMFEIARRVMPVSATSDTDLEQKIFSSHLLHFVFFSFLFFFGKRECSFERSRKRIGLSIYLLTFPPSKFLSPFSLFIVAVPLIVLSIISIKSQLFDRFNNDLEAHPCLTPCLRKEEERKLYSFSSYRKENRCRISRSY